MSTQNSKIHLKIVPKPPTKIKLFSEANKEKNVKFIKKCLAIS